VRGTRARAHVTSTSARGTRSCKRFFDRTLDRIAACADDGPILASVSGDENLEGSLRTRAGRNLICATPVAAQIGTPTTTITTTTSLLSGDALAAKVDPLLLPLLTKSGRTRVIVQATTAGAADTLIVSLGGTLGRSLGIIKGRVADLSNLQLQTLASSTLVTRVDLDRPTRAANERTRTTIGAAAVASELGLDGTGIGVAVIDSGVTGLHDDLASGSSAARVAHFADFVGSQASAYDDYGHGTHVAGIIAGNGYDSSGKRKGVAPGVKLVVLKALNASGGGSISHVIAALDYAVTNRQTYGIRIINLSVSAGVYQSFVTDPLTTAAKRATDAGIIVVAAAGNLGRKSDGTPQYRRVTAPANAPWVLAVGAASHMGSTGRSDDTIAGFSSRGPTHIDRIAKPDIVAPGVGIEPLSNPASAMYTTKSAYLLPGTVQVSYLPYLSLSGTSMATPVVAGTVAVMLQANPALTPNAVKAILQYTAETRSGYDLLTQGGGFLNARGAVRLAKYFADPAAGLPGGTSDHYASNVVKWSRHITWGNHRIGPGMVRPNRNAWRADVLWGAARTPEGLLVSWGSSCPATDPGCDNVVWGSADDGFNIVWGATCPAEDPNCDNVVWGSTGDDNVVWGSSCPADDPDCDNVVWGSSCPETDPDCDNVVWGSNCDPATDPNCDNVVWGSDCPETNPDCDNVVWGSSCPETDPNCDNVVWGSDSTDNVIWGFNRRRPDLLREEEIRTAYHQIADSAFTVKGVL